MRRANHFVTTQDDAVEQCRGREASTPYLFVVLQCDRPLDGSARIGLADVDQLTIGRGEARAVTRGRQGDREVLDLRLPGGTISSIHARLQRDGAEWILEDGPSKNGCLVNGERVVRTVLRSGDLIEIGPVFLRYRASLPCAPGAPVLDSAALDPPAPGFATLLPELASQLASLEHIARRPIPVLLLGETGSGKEVLARAIHALSGRPGPFVAVNCGGLTGTLVESQLFGHVKGAFTGAARDELGYIRSAERGTLLLDEIGDLPLSAQPALLRVLQEREVVPVGGTRPFKVDVRVVAATHRPLERLVMRGEFRGDLLARLSGYRHALPPLRGRIDELGLLVADLMRHGDPQGGGIPLSQDAGRWLLQHDWPLNIRELQQGLTVAAALATGGVIEPAHLRSIFENGQPSMAARAAQHPREGDELRQHIIALLERHRGNVTYVARDMGKARMQVHRWMQRFSIHPGDYRG